MRKRRLTILLFLFIIVLGFLFIRNRFDLSDLKLKPKLQSLNSLKQKLNLKSLSILIPKLNSGLTSTSTQASTSSSASRPTPESPISVYQRQDNHLSEYGSGDYDFTVEHQNRTRFYSVHVPPCFIKDTAIPVVINFHGGSSTAEKAEQGIGGMNHKANEACFIAVHPSGVSNIGQPGKKQYWNAGTLVQIPEVDPSIDDVGFISKMLDEIEGKFSIDTKKVYATGISNGAWMTYMLACELSDRITAIAPIAGGLVLESCNPKRPVSIIHFHGTSDPGWPYYGGNGCWTDTYRQPINETIQKWIKLNMCATSPKITYQKGEATCETYNCQEDSKITFCTIKGGGHTYPGGEVFQQLIPKWDNDCALGKGRGVGKTTQDIKALDAMWDFFKITQRINGL